MPRSRNIETIRVLLRSGEGARTLQSMGDRWSFLLMRDAFLGIRRFEDLRRRTGASRGTLTARLNALVEQGMLYRSPYGNAPSRLEYRLTEKGLAFYPVALCLWVWESHWGGEFGLPPRLVHTKLRQDAESRAGLQSLRSPGLPARRALRTGARRHALQQSAWGDAPAREPAGRRRRWRGHDDVPLRRHGRRSLDCAPRRIAFFRPAPLRRHQRSARHRDQHPCRPAAPPAVGGRDRAAPVSGQSAALRVPRDQEGLGPVPLYDCAA